MLSFSSVGTSLGMTRNAKLVAPFAAVAVHAEAGEALGLVGDVEVAVGSEPLQPVRRRAADLLEDPGEHRVVERRHIVERPQVPVEAHDRRPAELEMHVARSELHGVAEQPVQVHEGGIGCAAGRL